MSINFSPTPAELNIVSQIFASADPQKLGVLTGDVAVRIFGGAKLPPTVLGEIWNISDEDNKGWLPKKGVAMAVRLIGWAQKGEKITQALVNKAGPLAVIEGITTVSQQTTGMSLSKSPPPAAFPPLTPQDKVKFQNMFLKNGPANGLLSGEKARDIFVKSKLSNEQLLQIWNLADTQDRGALDATDFAIGMYFIQGVMTGKISFIPTSLPPGLYQQAGGQVLNNGSVRSHMTGNSGSFSPVNSVFPSQHTGQSQMLQPEYTGGAFKAPTLPARPQVTGQGNGRALEWDVTPAEKASADRYFESLDTQKKGYIEGEVAVPFMLKSNLPGEVLAQVWDLADINNDGCLTRDGFAVAMHLIQKKLAGKDIPATLPPSLVPPSARAAVPTSSPFAPAIQPQQPAVDLFSFDDTPPPSASPAQTVTFSPPTLQPQYTGAFQATPVKHTPEPDPFAAASFNTSPNRDLLSDDEVHTTASPPLHDQSAEIGNVKNQLQSTNRSLASAKQERETLEQSLANQAAQLSTFQTQLSSAKAAYETEVNLLATLKERRATQVADIQKTREELIRAESDLSAIRVEKAEIEGAFLRDKEEARDLHKRMVEAGQQAEALKADVDKLKKEAKQQKGLLAIARKQLSTKEAEKAKVEKDHEEAVAELNSVTSEKEGVETEITNLETDIANLTKATEEAKLTRSVSPVDSLGFAAAQPLPVSPEVASPTSVKSNNPFERLAMSSGNSTPRSQSPFQPLAASSILSSPPVSVISPSMTASTAPTETMQEASKPIEGLPVTSDDHPTTELSYLADDSTSNTLDSVLSPGTANGTEYFMTPPTSAQDDAKLEAVEKFPSLDSLPAPIALPSSSATTAAPTAAPAAPPESDHHETDLNSRLKELDIDESDSDSDDDNVPLGAKLNANGKVPVITPQKVEPASAPAPAPAANVSFDDVFGSDEHKDTTVTNAFDDAYDSGFVTSTTAPQDTSVHASEPINHFEAPKPAEAKPEIAGVNEFDQTFSKLPSSTAATPATFSFDAAFDDNFDFASASKANDFPPAPMINEPKEPSQSSVFDDAFGESSAPVPSMTPQPAVIAQPAAAAATSPTNAPNFATSFDQAFFDSVTAPKVEDKTLTTSPAPMANAPSSLQSVQGSFPSSPAPVSPKASAPSPRSSDVSHGPPRERSPPPRMVSPKPRLSSSSSKETAEKPQPAARHSKLSIRLPFGKKKKHSEPMPAPPAASTHLTPPIEEPQRTATPASEDDVEPVKQLTAMGFSRTQAVDALERYGYDVQKALNSLLGQ
ncbi:putative calcium-binding protein [Psilocybe cubensis]|uniref:Calcium-binding protein n=2 Tax=Psilocybe cubensis TaxID=181762 RepID=A0ACB8H761_PSICU|nr:putative calcium-binding protein [Psilocybe cubensis]KAH9483828.1 putative calcium-binding protein [Psilocybe cubensis]